jgi:hypothetical protein
MDQGEEDRIPAHFRFYLFSEMDFGGDSAEFVEKHRTAA